MDLSEPKPRHEEILACCQLAAGKSVWAIALTADEYGRHIWEAYCDDQKKLKDIPKTFRGHNIRAIFCEKPKI